MFTCEVINTDGFACSEIIERRIVHSLTWLVSIDNAATTPFVQ